jgi:putative DNA primase/helicase
VGSEKIARVLGLREVSIGRWHGQCPCCGYRSGFAVAERRNGLPLVYCNAGGCGQAELAAALRRRGLWPDHNHKEARSGIDPDEMARRREAKAHERSRKIALAADMWREAYPALGTLIETYLRSRDIVLPVPSAIRILGMHDAYGRHPTGARRPQMITRVEHVEHGPVAVHRTFLKVDGSGKATVDPVRISHGPVGGAAVRLASVGSILAIAEGIETALSYMQATGMPTWAALSAGGIRALVLPENVLEVVIAADPDPVGIMAAHAAARRWISEGRRVSIVRPPLGRDFNDIARAS